MLIKKIKQNLHKKRLYSQLKSVGINFTYDINSQFLTPKEIEIGNNVFIGSKAYIAAAVKIGNNVMFGPFPVIIGGDHYFGVHGKSNRFLKAPNRENMKQIIIEDEVWCGASVIILGGITLHKGAVVGAGSIVNKSLPPFTVCSGNPCKPIKLIFSDSELNKHLLLLGYSKDDASETILKRRNLINLFNLKYEDLKIIDHSKEYFDLYRNAK